MGGGGLGQLHNLNEEVCFLQALSKIKYWRGVLSGSYIPGVSYLSC